MIRRVTLADLEEGNVFSFTDYRSHSSDNADEYVIKDLILNGDTILKSIPTSASRLQVRFKTVPATSQSYVNEYTYDAGEFLRTFVVSKDLAAKKILSFQKYLGVGIFRNVLTKEDLYSLLMELEI